MRLFIFQLGGEFIKLWARPRTYLGFGGCLLFELCMSVLLRFPGIRAAIARDLWRSRLPLDQALSGLTSAAHLTGEAMTAVGTLALALVSSDLIAKEVEDGTLRMILCRPISRTRILAQKLVVGGAYAVVLALFISLSALAVGLIFEGIGPLTILAPHEGIVGTFELYPALERFALATALLAASACTGMLLAFTPACFGTKPATAAALALTLFFADDIVRTQPAFLSLRPYCLTTRFLTWRHAFNNEISWLKIRRNYSELLTLDLVLIAVSWCAFQRREFKP